MDYQLLILLHCSSPFSAFASILKQRETSITCVHSSVIVPLLLADNLLCLLFLLRVLCFVSSTFDSISLFPAVYSNRGVYSNPSTSMLAYMLLRFTGQFCRFKSRSQITYRGDQPIAEREKGDRYISSFLLACFQSGVCICIGLARPKTIRGDNYIFIPMRYAKRISIQNRSPNSSRSEKSKSSC